MSAGAAVAEAARRLAATSDTPRLDAELLMAHALGRDRGALLLGGMADPAPAEFAGLVARRLAHEPVAYLVGLRAFWTIELAVTPAVLIPRPETETLLEAAVARFGSAGPARILDLGTGSGALLLGALAEWPAATGVGVDASAPAVAVARGNVARLGFGERARIEEVDWARAGDGGFDLVLCNPPYVGTGETLPPAVLDYEPHAALFAGADGLDDYRALASLLRLPAGGIACIEIGAAQAASASALFEGAGFRVVVRKDLGGRDRCLVLSQANDFLLGKPGASH